MFAKMELQIKQNLQKYEQKTKKKLVLSTSSSANILLAFAEGKIQQFVRSGFQAETMQRITDQVNFLTRSLTQ